MRKLTLGLVVVAAVAALGAPVHALGCEGVALDDGCLFTITGGDTPDLDDGYAVTNGDGVPLWDFVREREAQAIGYPISQRWTEGPFTLQAFQKVILQWDPGKQRMNYLNTLDALGDRYPWVQLPFVPPHQILEEDRGATFGTIIRNHLALLDQNEAIKDRFLSEPDWLNLYGLPIRYEEREVAGHPAGVQLLRAQRTVFVVWNVPAAGVTVGRVNLQNVPDKLKQLSNVIIPDAAKTLYRAPNPDLHHSIRALPWVADGTTKAEEETVLLRRKLHSSSQYLFSRLLLDLSIPWLQRSPDLLAEGALEMLLGIADISWTRRHIGPAEPGLIRLLLRAPQHQWPPAFREILLKPWIHDGVTWNELRFADAVLYFLLTAPDGSGAYSGRHQDVNTIIHTMLNMPFLASFEGYELDLVTSLPGLESAGGGPGMPQRIVGGPEYTLDVLAEFARHGGITDHHALTHIVHRPFKINLNPVEYVQRLNESYADLHIDERIGFDVRSGHVRLFVIRDREDPMPADIFLTLQSVLQEVVAFMGVPFPNDYLILHVAPFYLDRQGEHAYDFTLINEQYFGAQSISADMRRAMAHLVAHYYWENNTHWIDEGVATVHEYGLGYRGPAWVPEVGSPERESGSRISCRAREQDEPVNSIAEIDDDNVFSRIDCETYFGTHMFLELYRGLDRMSFHDGLARLFDEIYGGMYIYCYDRDKVLGIPCRRPDRTSDVDAVTKAFTFGASPESAAIARTIIGRWYYGP